MRYAIALAALALAACDNLAPATGGYDPIGAMMMGNMMQRSAQPAYYAPPPQRMVSCNQVGNQLYCY